MTKPKLRDLTAVEVRRVNLDRTLLRAADSDGEPMRFKGHAAVFDSPTWIGPPQYGYQEIIARGAFSKTVDESDVRFLINHDPNLVLARTAAGTLELREDKVGLAVDADIAPTTYGKDLAVSLERGDVSQMSFGFRVIRDRWEEVEGEEGNKFERRTIEEVELFDVSTVTYPAYDDTDGGLAAATQARELRDRRTADVERRTDGAPAETRQPEATADKPETTSDAAPTKPEATSTLEPAASPSEQEPEQRHQGDDALPLWQILLDHTAGAHAGTSRAKCPPCVKAAAAAPTSASTAAAA